jgi:hypothetical protein
MLLANMDLSPHDSQEGEAGLKPFGLLRVVLDNAREQANAIRLASSSSINLSASGADMASDRVAVSCQKQA